MVNQKEKAWMCFMNILQDACLHKVLYFLALKSPTLGSLYCTAVSLKAVHYRRKAMDRSSAFYPVELPN